MNVKSRAMSRTRGSGTGGSAQLEGVCKQEEGQSSWRKVQSWTWKCLKPLAYLTEEAEQEQEQT